MGQFLLKDDSTTSFFTWLLHLPHFIHADGCRWNLFVSCPRSIPLCGFPTIYVCILLLTGLWMASSLGLLQTMLPRMHRTGLLGHVERSPIVIWTRRMAGPVVHWPVAFTRYHHTALHHMWNNWRAQQELGLVSHLLLMCFKFCPLDGYK